MQLPLCRGKLFFSCFFLHRVEEELVACVEVGSQSAIAPSSPPVSQGSPAAMATQVKWPHWGVGLAPELHAQISHCWGLCKAYTSGEGDALSKRGRAANTTSERMYIWPTNTTRELQLFKIKTPTGNEMCNPIFLSLTSLQEKKRSFRRIVSEQMCLAAFVHMFVSTLCYLSAYRDLCKYHSRYHKL